MPTRALGPKRPVSPADILLSAGLYAAFVIYIWSEYRSQFTPLALLGAANAGLLLAKKRLPLITLVGSVVLAAVMASMMRRPYPATTTVLISLYEVGRYTGRRVATTAGVATLAVWFAFSQWNPRIPMYGLYNIGRLGWIPFATVAGMWVRTQREYVVVAESRARRAELERDAETRSRVAEERVRIARELHDVVGHAIMSISVQSSVGAKVVLHNPEAGRDALSTIAEISRTALGEIRTTLSLLREGAEDVRRPELGIEDVPTLVERTRASGVPVRLVQSGRSGTIPTIVGFTVYRVIQESLTNIGRHAHAVTWAEVAIIDSEDEVDVTVTNNGTEVEEPVQPGIGLQGMRERVTATGGRLEVGPRNGGGFRVSARLPLREPGHESPRNPRR